MEDPESFLKGLGNRRIVLDEVHRLPNPSEMLKIAADHFPNVRVLATRSSTLGASSRFRDTLTGRKTELWLTPMIEADLAGFGNVDLPHRLLHGGLPPFFLSSQSRRSNTPATHPHGDDAPASAARSPWPRHTQFQRIRGGQQNGSKTRRAKRTGLPSCPPSSGR